MKQGEGILPGLKQVLDAHWPGLPGWTGGVLVFTKRLFALTLAVISAGCVREAVALDEDFDANLIAVQLYLGTTQNIRGIDGDGNGLLEEDQLGLLSQILLGGDPVACIDPARISAIQAGYTANYNAVPPQVTVNISGVGTVNLISQLQTIDPELGDALQALIAGIMCIADVSTITYVNALADALVAQVLTGTPQANEIQNVQNQITFTAADFATFGNAGDEPNYLGAAGDIDNDSETNLAEYEDLATKNRENWLTACCVTPPLRIVNYVGGGTKVSGLNMDFTVSSAGAAGPVSIEWRKGTKANSTLLGTNATFSIPFLNTTDNGKYFAIIDDGVYTRSAPLLTLSVVFVPLFITQQISGASRPEGGSKTFTVGVQGGQPGPYVYTWRKNGDIVGPNAASYTISPLIQADAGSYSVSVTSNNGGDTVTSGPVNFVVTGANQLSISAQPQSVSKNVGTSHTFSITATGASGNYNYNWRKGGTSLGAPNLSTYTINTILPSDAGNYSCIVTDAQNNALSVTSQNATLTVTGGLSISQQPQGKSLLEGESYSITIAVSGGSGSYSYDWRKGGTSLGAPDENAYLISSASLDDVGVYSCVVTDFEIPGLSITSANANITLNLDPLQFAQQPTGGTVVVGGEIQLIVAVTGGSGTYIYDWRKGGVSTGAPNLPILTLSSVNAENSGNYTCRVTDALNPGTAITSQVASVNVVDTLPLQIDSQPVGGAVYTGDQFSFSIEVSGGSGTYNYAWTRNNSPVCDCNSASFSLSPITLGDAGAYRCTVTDQANPGLSITSETVELNVAAPLSVSTQPIGGEFLAGQSLALSCAISGGLGTLSYTWLLNGEPVPDAPDAPTLDLGPLRLAEAGDYTCQVADDFTDIETEVATVDVQLVNVPLGLLNYNVDLLGSNAVPPNASIASGRVIGTLSRVGADPAAGATLSYSTVQTIGDDALRLQLFVGGPGVLGELLLDAGDALLAQVGTLTLTEEEMSIIYAGYAYWAVTSNTYPNGELRAQVFPEYTPPPDNHSADPDGSGSISLSELLRVIQFFNVGSLHCQPGSEDGYAPGGGSLACAPHSSDYNPQDWSISLSELLRLIQIYNVGAFYPCGGGEDGYCLGNG